MKPFPQCLHMAGLSIFCIALTCLHALRTGIALWRAIVNMIARILLACHNLLKLLRILLLAFSSGAVRAYNFGEHIIGALPQVLARDRREHVLDLSFRPTAYDGAVRDFIDGFHSRVSSTKIGAATTVAPPFISAVPALYQAQSGLRVSSRG